MRRNRLGVMLIGLAVVVIIALQVYNQLVEGGILKKSAPRTPAQKAGDEILKMMDDEGGIGEENAPIKVLVYVPISREGFPEVVKKLVDYAETHSSQVRMTVLDKSDTTTAARASELGATFDKEMSQIRATVLVNGKNSFTLTGPDGKPREVTFMGQPGMAGPAFTAEDVIQAIRQEAGGK